MPSEKVVDGQDVTADVHAVLKQIKTFSNKFRSGKWTGATGQALTDVVAIGIGGSYLGPEFVAEALRCERRLRKQPGRRLRFLANVDPIDVSRAFEGLDPETTLVIVISKTFTTAETMMNARTARDWVVKALGAEAVCQAFRCGQYQPRCGVRFWHRSGKYLRLLGLGWQPLLGMLRRGHAAVIVAFWLPHHAAVSRWRP